MTIQILQTVADIKAREESGEIMPVYFAAAWNPYRERLEPIACFAERWGDKGTLTAYAREGQHHGASRDYIREQKAATIEQAAPLLRELRGIYEDTPDAPRLQPISRQAFLILTRGK